MKRDPRAVGLGNVGAGDGGAGAAGLGTAGTGAAQAGAVGVALFFLMALGLSGCHGNQNPSGPTGPELEPGNHEFTLEVDGRLRRYLVRVPPRESGGQQAGPVLIAFHGGGGNPDQFRASAGLDSLADAQGLLLVYPAGTGQLSGVLTWNAGPGCCGYARDQGVDDVAFFRTLVLDLMERHRFDSRRVYITGHSNGSMMAYRIAAEASELISGVVGVAGTMQLPSVSPTSPVPILHIHSMDDPRAFYEGGIREDRVHPPVAEMLERWAAVNGCAGPPAEAESRAGVPGSSDAGQTARLLVWSCSGAPLEHWQLTGSGHAWPGHRVSAARELILGSSTELVKAPEEIWRFLEGLG